MSTQSVIERVVLATVKAVEAEAAMTAGVQNMTERVQDANTDLGRAIDILVAVTMSVESERLSSAIVSLKKAEMDVVTAMGQARESEEKVRSAILAADQICSEWIAIVTSA